MGQEGSQIVLLPVLESSHRPQQVRETLRPETFPSVRSLGKNCRQRATRFSGKVLVQPHCSCCPTQIHECLSAESRCSMSSTFQDPRHPFQVASLREAPSHKCRIESCEIIGAIQQLRPQRRQESVGCIGFGSGSSSSNTSSSPMEIRRRMWSRTTIQFLHG
mmetsp:Transcript_80722/g.177080  ORF Transcript_80722/g.177080 Transcript_80722/m.177080 type:complete len:162 (+) Transcript_80722:2174-2659(+)